MAASSIFLIQAFIIVVVPVVLLRISRLKGLLPLVAVQIMLGIALGPSFFGKVAPGYFQVFASPAALSSLTGLATIAVMIFGLISGLHVDPLIFNGKERVFWPVATANVLFPMILGCLAGYWILARYPEELPPGVSPAVFIVAMGISLSMTALPVLGAILGEMNLLGSRIGQLALGIAGINNITLWVLLGILLTAAAAGRAGYSHGAAGVYLLVSAPVYLLFMVRVVRPTLVKLVTARMQAGDQGVTTRGAVVGAATIASALATDLMGLHFIIGAFLVGAIIPANLHKPILDRLQVMTIALLMPFFFTLTGMRTLIDLSSPGLFQFFSIAIGVGAIGIVGGTAVAARLIGERWSFGVGLGSLLQAKGLTELIVLTVLLDAGIISPRIFAAMILMAVCSTALATPLARFALGRSSRGSLIMQPLTAPGQPV
ncbi:MAG TPA: cation:proton antiporter [Terriglobia bacterium]|nr:cation:proton antiporter [Terriglobia bacterium]